MPLILPDRLPAIELLKKENIFVTDDQPDVRPLRIALLNLMPIKITTETDFIRLLSCTPLRVEVALMKIRSHTPKHTSAEHMRAFYRYFDEMKHESFDGLIVTGAPLEHLDYEQVTYWAELQEVFDWAARNVRSTCYICWAAQAALYHFFGIPKYPTEKKIFGVFRHTVLHPEVPLFRGFDDEFHAPHSRHSEVRRADIERVPDLCIMAESAEAGVHIVAKHGGSAFFITGHSEYAPLTLDGEYRRDLAKGLPIDPPAHYYPNDDASQPPVVRWRAHAHLLFMNWLNHYVHQNT